jgi:hypothetical protein
MPKAEADAYWASNFGFGIIRSALKPGFRLERAPDAEVGGHPVHGSLITVTIDGVPPEARGALEAQVHQRLAPLTMRHEIAWR